MKTIPVRNSIICQNNDSIFNYYGWPSIARLPDKTLAMVASGHRLGHICSFGKAVMCYSRDEGRSWGEQIIIIDTLLDDRDAGICVFGDGTVIITSFNNTAAEQRNYLTWRGKDDMCFSIVNDYIEIIEKMPETEKKHLGSTFRLSKDGGYVFGEIKHSPVTAPHGPVVMNDGNLLYVGKDHHIRGETNPIKCYKLYPDGNMEYLCSIEDVQPETGNNEWLNCEPHAVVLPDGKIITHIRMQCKNDDFFTVYQAESSDGGKSFTVPHPIGLAHGSPPHLLLHSSGVLISSYGYRREPFGQRVMLSKDGGETWDTDYILRDDGNNDDLGYPATVELNDRSLLTVYYQAEKNRDNCVIMQSIWELPADL